MVESLQFLSPHDRVHVAFDFIDDEGVKVYDVTDRVSYTLFRLEVMFQLEKMMANHEFYELMGEMFAPLKPYSVDIFQAYV